jgi:hypothetical protein
MKAVKEYFCTFRGNPWVKPMCRGCRKGTRLREGVFEDQIFFRIRSGLGLTSDRGRFKIGFNGHRWPHRPFLQTFYLRL